MLLQMFVVLLLFFGLVGVLGVAFWLTYRDDVRRREEYEASTRAWEKLNSKD